ncbi:MAG: amidase [Pseudomonadota bacterium]
MSGDLWAKSLAEVSELIRSKAVSPVDVLDGYLARIAALDGRIHSTNALRADAARAEAKQAETDISQGNWCGPLHGIPIGIKDLIDVAGLPTTAQAAHRRDAIASADAGVVRALRRAGAVIIGKHATAEYAVGMNEDGAFPAVRNPWNLDLDPAGSSSGSSAAVAAGFCAGAVGSDTAGSIRDPAAWCGVVGLKPTDGLVSRAGLLPLSRTMDCLGPIARTAQDCALMLAGMISDDPVDLLLPGFAAPDLRQLQAGIKGLRIGIPRHCFENDPNVDAEVLAATAQAIQVLASLGAQISTVSLDDFATYGRVARQITWPEEYAEHGAELRDHPDRFTPVARSRLQDGKAVTAPDYINAMRQRTAMIAALDQVMQTVDVLFLPSMKTPAQPLGYEHGPMGEIELSLSRPFNLTGSPALTICTGFTAQGLPIGGQFVGRWFEDGTVLQAGHALEKEVGQRTRHPPLTG